MTDELDKRALAAVDAVLSVAPNHERYIYTQGFKAGFRVANEWRCATCAHWAKHSDDHLGDCARWKMGYKLGARDIPANEVHVENDEGWGAQMGPDFGCVLWQAKKPTP